MLIEREYEDRRKGHWLEMELRQIDDNLRVRFFDSDYGVPWIKPGRWHVLRLNGEAPPSAMPVEYKGEYAEPGDWVLDEIRERDSWKLRGSLRDHVQAHKEKEKAARKRDSMDERQNAKEEFVLAAKGYMTPRPTFGRYKRGKDTREVYKH